MKNIRLNIRDVIIIDTNKKLSDAAWNIIERFWYNKNVFDTWSEVCDSIWKAICRPNQRQYAIPLKNPRVY